MTKSTLDFGRKLKAALKSGAKEVWIGGGDGTVRQAAGILQGKDVILGILPLGTGNNLANELGIPAEPKGMVSFLASEAEEKSIDVGMFGDEAFVNVATVGMTSRIAFLLQKMNKEKVGRLVYIPAAYLSFVFSRRLYLRIESDNFNFEGKVVQAVIASSKLHAGPFKVIPNAELTDGHLAVYVVKAKTRWEAMRYGWMLVRGRHAELPYVITGKMNSGHIHLKRSKMFVLDGDLTPCSGTEIKVLPHALRVLCAPAVES